MSRYKNWGLTHCFPNIKSMGWKNGWVSWFPVAPMIVIESLLKFPFTVFSTEQPAPIATKMSNSSLTSSLPSLAVTRCSAGKESSGPPQWPSVMATRWEFCVVTADSPFSNASLSYSVHIDWQQVSLFFLPLLFFDEPSGKRLIELWNNSHWKSVLCNWAFNCIKCDFTYSCSDWFW